MRTVRIVTELRAALAAPRRAGRRIGLVPTMGALHAGHLSLIRHAREECDEVVMSLFVNPTQFNDPSDLSAYPRDHVGDAALAADAGVDYLFAPALAEIYPSGFATTVSVAGITDTLEGAHRGTGHFDGVSTVVTKLFNMVSPDISYFGQKDAQQAVVIKRLVRDLDIPAQIRICPTVRDPDGLALSSRNVHLSPADRARATSLHRALRAIEAAVADGVSDPAAAVAAGRDELARNAIEPEYLELVSPQTLVPVSELAGEMLAVVAARVGSVRLIDNQPIQLLSSAGRLTAGAAGSTDSGRA